MTPHQSRPSFARVGRRRTCPTGAAPECEPRNARQTFHRSMAGYAPTPLAELPALARECSVASIHVKDESHRLDLPAFKILGASWAANRAISKRLEVAPRASLAELRRVTAGSGLTLVTATDGNHGRALARMASLLGISARIYVPGGTPVGTLDAIRSEGATLIDTDVAYDDAVVRAAASVDGNDVLIQDTSWAGYEEVPGWIVAGYATLFAEIDAQLPAGPTLVVVPTGVGSLLQAALAHYATDEGSPTRVLAVEPVTAACVTASLTAGHPVTVETTAPTPMAGLNCGTVSRIAWPLIHDLLDGAIGVTNDESIAAVAAFAAQRVSAGPCGAASYAGLLAVSRVPDLRGALGIDPAARVVLLSTEGALDAEGVGARAASCADRSGAL